MAGQLVLQGQALAVEPCFVRLLPWVLSGWQGTQLALALDATLLGTRFAGLAVSVVYRGAQVNHRGVQLLLAAIEERVR